MARKNPKYGGFRRLGPKLKPKDMTLVQSKTQLRKQVNEIIKNVNEYKVWIYTDIRLEEQTHLGMVVSDRPDTETVEIIVHIIADGVDKKVIWRSVCFEYNQCKLCSIAPDWLDMFEDLTDELFNYVVGFVDSNVERKYNRLLGGYSGVQYTKDCEHVMDFLE